MSEKITFEYGLTQHFTVIAIGPTGEDKPDPEWDAFEQRMFQTILAHPPLLHAICQYTVLMAMDDEGTYAQEVYGEDDGFDQVLLSFIDCFAEEDRKWLRKQFEYEEERKKARDEGKGEDEEFIGESVIFYWGMEWFKAEPSGFHVNRYEVVKHVHEASAPKKKIRHHKRGK